MGESLRERLRNKRRPSAPCRLRIDDTAPAQRALEEAVVALRLAQAGDSDAETLEGHRQAVREARAALEGCYEPITLLALPPADLEALIAAHPPRKDDDNDVEWNNASFPRALFLACVQGDLSSEEWETILAESCSDGEVNALEQAAIAINVRAPEGTVPKGLIETLS